MPVDSPAPPAPALAAAVVAWHNRHPLAARILAEQVVGFGVVALPFAAPGAPPLGKVVLAPAVPPPFSEPARPAAAPASDRRASARSKPTGKADPTGLQPAFADDLIDGLSLPAIAEFALRHGSETRPEPADWPQRDLPLAPDAERTLPVVRFVYSAAIEVGSQRQRVLIGSGPAPVVLGVRLRSRGRQGVAAAGLAGLVACVGLAAALWGQAGDAAPAATEVSAPPAASPDPVAAGAAGAATAEGAGAAASASLEAPAAEAAAMAADPASGPVEPSSPVNAATPAQADDSTPPRGIRPMLSEAERELARREAAQLRGDPRPEGLPGAPGASAGVAPGADPGTAAGASPEVPPGKLPSRGPGSGPAVAKAAASGAASNTVYAVVTPTTRTRAGSQLRLVLMDAPTTPVPGQAHAEVMPTAQGFRAVLWPFATREEAEEVRANLAARGIPAEVIEF